MELFYCIHFFITFFAHSQIVNKAVGSGGADIAGQIDNALREAKKYIDDALTIVVF